MIDFSLRKINTTEVKAVRVRNELNEPAETAEVGSPFSVESFEAIEGEFPASKTLYFDEYFRFADASDNFNESDLGYGRPGLTNSSKQLGCAISMASIIVDAPSSTAKFNLSDTIQVDWTSNLVSQVNIVIESASAIKTYSGIAASLGTYNVDLTSPDSGTFQVNQEITITVEATLGIVADSVNVNSISTITINAIGGQTENVAFNVTGTSNGSEVEVFYRVASPIGSWTSAGTATVSSGSYTKSVTISTAETYDIKVEDTTDSDGYAQQDDIVVASGTILATDRVYSSVDVYDAAFQFDPQLVLATNLAKDRLVLVGGSLYGSSSEVYTVQADGTIDAKYTNGGAYEGHDGEVFDADYIYTTLYYVNRVYKVGYTLSSPYFKYDCDGSGYTWGIFRDGSTFYILKDDGKIYSGVTPFSTLTEVADFSGQTFNASTCKHCTLDTTNNILYIRSQNDKLLIINWATKTVISVLDITVVTGFYGISHFQGRLCVVSRKNNNTFTLTTLKNNNDA